MASAASATGVATWRGLDSCLFPVHSGVHPPPFHPDHRLSDCPECRLEIRCSCGRSAFVRTRMLIASRGDHAFKAILPALKCERCGARPAPVYLLAGEHRQHCWGAALGWAIELRGKLA